MLFPGRGLGSEISTYRNLTIRSNLTTFAGNAETETLFNAGHEQVKMKYQELPPDILEATEGQPWDQADIVGSRAERQKK